MKRIIMLFVFLLILGACSEKDQATPNDRFQDYVDHWNELEFDQMYEMFSKNAANTYSEDQSVLRTQSIYNDIGVSDLQVSFEELNEEQLDIAMKEGTATIPFNVQLETTAGPISFEHEATLIQQEEKDEDEDSKNWYIEWESGFIFPALKENGQIQIKTTAPKRGEILDRNQMPLAINDTIYEIGIVPGNLGENPEQSKQKVADLLGMSEDAIDTALNAAWVEDNLFVPLKSVQPKEALLSELLAIDGVQSREMTGRVYPAGEAAAHLVGYIRNVTADDLEKLDSSQYSANDKIGSRGLEQLYEEQLKGKKGIRIVIANEGEEDIVLAETPVEDGETITTTIDINIQEKIFNTFKDDAGTAAAVDPKTGEALALVSSPSFDPNEVLYGTSGNFWEKLEEDERNPVLNRFSATFAPGSVIKPITGAIGLTNGSIKLGDGIEINGLTWSNGEGWGDYEVRRVSTSNGPVDLADALIRSDNIFFARKAVEMGAKSYTDGLKEFGFEEEFPFEYPVTSSTISSSGKLDDEVLLANSSYGQGELEMNVLHLALTYAPFLNDGNMVKPTLLTSEETGQVWKEGLVTAEQANAIKDALRKVVTDGTGRHAQASDFPISGKTGTAELKLSNDSSGDENGWFVGYPTDGQDIIIAMMVEKVQDKESGLATKKVTDAFNKIK
ncbi:penicillin-binding transpeptidase domain-containing protein [Oceanobacillus sp. FSL K6-2867]|uniref:penicillin-binding transpeptidase domain-containing protein n=1 Tax=Oceanobacillus sp. FSL K6-2867 TaxID=2954748 RepID=UPI0030DCD3FA